MQSGRLSLFAFRLFGHRVTRWGLDCSRSASVPRSNPDATTNCFRLAFGEKRMAKGELRQLKADPRGRARWAANEPAHHGGGPPRFFRHLRMAEHRTPNPEPGPLFIEYRFKKRIPPAPTLQAGYWLRCYEKAGWMARGRKQIVGNQLAGGQLTLQGCTNFATAI